MTTPFKFPEIWKKDDAMESLFKPLANNKFLNPVAFSDKITFWTHLIDDYAIHNNIIFIENTKMKKMLSRNNNQPLCLDQIFELMHRLIL